MLMTKEVFSDIYLEGKSADDILAEVTKLKEEIVRLKLKIESPTYPYETHPFPSERDMLESCRLYLITALDALSAMGVTLPLSEAEHAIRRAAENVPHIRKVSLNIGTYLERSYELKIYAQHAILNRVNEGRVSVDIPLSRDSAMSTLADLRLGEWNDTYFPEQYGAAFNEPTRWRLLVEYDNNFPPKLSEGVGIFPYNFDDLKRLMGVED